MELNSVGLSGGGGGGGFVAGPLLSGIAGNNNDTVAGAPVLGDLIVGNATPLWARLPIGTVGQVLTVVAGPTAAWAAAPAGAGGWTDDGTVVRLTTASDQVGINTVSPKASYRLQVNATNAASGGKLFVLAGSDAAGGTDNTDGMACILTNNTPGNRQIALFDSAQVGNAAKYGFRYVVGFGLPTIDGVNGDVTAQANINFGGGGGGGSLIGIGFSAGTAVQADVQAQLHVKPLSAATIGIISQCFASQTANLFEARDSSGNDILRITAAGDITDPATLFLGSDLGGGIRVAQLVKFDTSVNLPAGAVLALNSASTSASGDSGFVKSSSSGGNLSSFYDGTEYDRMSNARRFLRATQPGVFGAIGDTNPVARLGGNNHIDGTPVGNGADNTEDTLITYSLPAATLSANGDRVCIDSFGRFAGNGTLKRVRVYFGAKVLFDTGAAAFNGTKWRIMATVIRLGATTQVSAALFAGDITLVTQIADVQSPGETLAGAVTIKTTGQCTATGAANDIVNDALAVDVFPFGA